MTNKILLEVSVNRKKVVVTLGDITDERCDAIVNAADSSLIHGGGVAGAIVKKGGWVIQKESNEIGGVDVGEVAVTSAGRLESEYVIHAVGPRWGEGDEEKKLRNAVKNSLLRASELNLNSLAMPAISCGIFGFPKERGASIIVDEVLNFLTDTTTSLERINLCTTDGRMAKLFSDNLQRKLI